MKSPIVTGALAVVFAVSVASPAFADSPGPAPGKAAGRPITISVVTTTDVHGRVESLPWLSGHLANLRAQRARDGGAVVLVDSGDMFQGTLESNLGEGAAMVRGYNALGYAAAAIGNHEFDFGPAGPAHIPASAADDPRGALKARAAEAKFPFLSANVFERGAATAVAWRNVRPFVVVEAAGVRVGIIGVTTKGTPFATHPRNFVGLHVHSLLDTITAAARAARGAGAVAVIVAAHAGGDCERADRPDDLASCDPRQEIFALARDLPPGLVDMIAAGHTHQMVAHRVAGISIVQAWSEGRGFGRVDLIVHPGSRTVQAAHLLPLRHLCGGGRVPTFSPTACAPPPYEGKPVLFDASVARALAPDVAAAQSRRNTAVGVTLDGPLRRQARVESPLGNFTADLMRATVPDANFAFINGGSLRSDLPAGPLLYGRLYEALPFDDGIAVLTLTPAQVTALIARNLERQAGILSISGITARARCQKGQLQVDLIAPTGGIWPAHQPFRAVTNGYLASGGDGLLTGIADLGIPEAMPLRDRLAAHLTAQGGTVATKTPKIFAPQSPRLSYPAPRPVRCR